MCAPDLVCSVEADHHSDDIVEVWHGASDPLYVCGFHVSMGVWSS